MKQTLEEAVNEIGGVHPDWDKITCFRIGFKEGARWQSKQAIEILSSVLENWVHGGDADCIIAEFEEKLKNNVWNIQQKQQKGISSFDEILEANKDVLERIKQKGD